MVTVRRAELLLVAVLSIVFGAAPTVGDIGSCGRAASDLDMQEFAASRKDLDCKRCGECHLATETCTRACDPNAPSDVGWPGTCHPVQHDGEVCLDALQAASCGAYAPFVADANRTVPTECEFCRILAEAGVP